MYSLTSIRVLYKFYYLKYIYKEFNCVKKNKQIFSVLQIDSNLNEYKIVNRYLLICSAFELEIVYMENIEEPIVR